MDSTSGKLDWNEVVGLLNTLLATLAIGQVVVSILAGVFGQSNPW